MKVEYSLANGLKGVFEGTSKEVFEQLSSFQETFGNDKCGRCGNTDVKFVVRTIEDNTFYEMVCGDLSCRAKLAFGTPKADNKSLYPRRVETEGKGKAVKDENGRTKYLPNQGWIKFGES